MREMERETTVGEGVRERERERPQWEWMIVTFFVRASFCAPVPVAAEILQANDSLTEVINLYRLQVKGEQVNTETAPKLTGEQSGRWPED